MLAEDYLRMGIVKAQKMEPLEPSSDGISKAILVVGGGITGITAALEAADADYDVVLVEKSRSLGVAGARSRSISPRIRLTPNLRKRAFRQKIQKVTCHPKIKVYTSTTNCEDRRPAGHVRRHPAERRPAVCAPRRARS